MFCFKFMLRLIVAAKHQFKYCAGLEDNFAAIYFFYEVIHFHHFPGKEAKKCLASSSDLY
jgi:hypothetical protein